MGSSAWWVDSVAALCIGALILKEGVHVCQSANSDDFSGSACDCSTHAGDTSHDEHDHKDESSSFLCSILNFNMNQALYDYATKSLRTSSGALRLPPPPDTPIGGGKYTESGQFDDSDSEDDSDEDEEEKDNKKKTKTNNKFEIVDMDVIQTKYEEKLELLKQQQQTTIIKEEITTTNDLNPTTTKKSGG